MPTMNYPEKWVCLNPKCQAIHLDKFSKCRRCGHPFLGRRDNTMNDHIDLRVEIDPLGLDKELAIQARMVRHWSEKTAEAQAAYDTAKSALATIEAELRMSIAKNPGSYGLEKTTSDMLNAAVLVHPEYKIADKKLIKARYELDMCKAAVSALQDKKRALSLLTELWIKDYYNSHSLEPKSLTEEGEQYNRSRIMSAGRERRKRREDEDNDNDGDT